MVFEVVRHPHFSAVFLLVTGPSNYTRRLPFQLSLLLLPREGIISVVPLMPTLSRLAKVSMLAEEEQSKNNPLARKQNKAKQQ